MKLYFFLIFNNTQVRNSGMTDPDIAAEFVKKTGVDALAILIGTARRRVTEVARHKIKLLRTFVK